MSDGIIYGFKGIQIDKNHSEQFFQAPGQINSLFQTVPEKSAVGKTGQPVIKGQISYFFFSFHFDHRILQQVDQDQQQFFMVLPPEAGTLPGSKKQITQVFILIGHHHRNCCLGIIALHQIFFRCSMVRQVRGVYYSDFIGYHHIFRPPGEVICIHLGKGVQSDLGIIGTPGMQFNPIIAEKTQKIGFFRLEKLTT